jgi:oxazoline/thiazoline dehydrogenase
MATLFLALRDEVTLAADGAGHLLARGEAGAITLKRLTPGVREALHRLANGGASEEELAEGIGDLDDPAGLGTFYYYLRLLGQHGWLLRSVKVADTLLATLAPTSPSFNYPGHVTLPDRPYVLSRFASLHAEAGQIILQSPLAHAQVRLHAPQLSALVGVLARPVRPREAAAQVPGLSEEAARLFLDLRHGSNPGNNF